MTLKAMTKTAVLGLLAAGAVVTSTAPAQAQPYFGHPYGHRYWGPHRYWGGGPGYWGGGPGPYFWGGRHWGHRRWYCGYYGRGCAWRYW